MGSIRSSRTLSAIPSAHPSSPISTSWGAHGSGLTGVCTSTIVVDFRSFHVARLVAAGKAAY